MRFTNMVQGDRKRPESVTVPALQSVAAILHSAMLHLLPYLSGHVHAHAYLHALAREQPGLP